MSDHDRITISLSIETDIDLAVSDVWPDGDAPDEITAQAVQAVIEATGSKRRMMDEWCLVGDLDFTVVVTKPNPGWSQDETLFESPPAQWIREVARPWTPYAVETRT